SPKTNLSQVYIGINNVEREGKSDSQRPLMFFITEMGARNEREKLPSGQHTSPKKVASGGGLLPNFAGWPGPHFSSS
ncbi:MAG TPA: hypothetical protein VKR06_17795, partial [Ktedonosporobacter sp.]|nr:hypothetical protein [Ktedonosporobacter sp.]